MAKSKPKQSRADEVVLPSARRHEASRAERHSIDESNLVATEAQARLYGELVHLDADALELEFKQEG